MLTHDQVNGSSITKITSQLKFLGKNLHLVDCATVCVKTEVMLTKVHGLKVRFKLSETRSTLYIPALTLPFSSVFFDSFSITLLYSRRRGSWLWHSPVNTNTAIICVMGVSLNLTTPIKFSLTLINTDVHCILCKVYNRVDSSNITSQTWIFYFFRFFSQKTETEFWLLYIKIPKSDYSYT